MRKLFGSALVLLAACTDAAGSADDGGSNGASTNSGAGVGGAGVGGGVGGEGREGGDGGLGGTGGVDGPPSTHFASSPLTWSVPSEGGEYGFYQVAGSHWATLDIDADGRLDLVHTSDGNPVWGGDANAHWKVYRGEP
jgi:hypothetical protein